MITLITFGRFDKLSEKDIKRDKQLFIEIKKRLVTYPLYFEHNESKIKEIKEMNELQIDDLIKENFLEIENNSNVKLALYSFLFDIGICGKLLDDDEKKEFLGMKLTYENCGSFALNYYKKFIEKAKMECPPEIYVCFEDKAFITYCQYQKSEIKKNNFLSFVKNYFILDKLRPGFENFRNNRIFNKIRDQMIELYPKLKAEYGRSIIFDKFMSFIEEDNDYNIEFIKEILDNYNKKNQNKYIKLKQKQD